MSRQEMFREYPDVVNIEQLCEMLGGVSVKAAYQRLHSGETVSYTHLTLPTNSRV